jgi:hypothetical protein
MHASASDLQQGNSALLCSHAAVVLPLTLALGSRCRAGGGAVGGAAAAAPSNPQQVAADFDALVAQAAGGRR